MAGTPAYPATPAGSTTVASPKPFGSRGAATPGRFQPSAIAAFPQFTAPLEGRLTYAYQDKRGLVTTGAGYLIDPVDAALVGPNGVPLAWQIDGRAATQAEITTQWNLMKSNTDPSRMSVGAKDMPGNTMRLTYAAVDALTMSKVTENATVLGGLFPNVLNWPADAQLGILGVTWGTGPNLRSPSASYMAPFVASVDADDFSEMVQLPHGQTSTPIGRLSSSFSSRTRYVSGRRAQTTRP